VAFASQSFGHRTNWIYFSAIFRIMGKMIEFPSNGTNGVGYLATPTTSNGKAIVVIQEWWGLVDHIKDVCDRFAALGYLALAPDLYHGKVATEPDEAGKYMMALEIDKFAKDLSGAVDELMVRAETSKVGVVGFCMGGGLALVLAANRPDAVGAVAPFYGVIPWPEAAPDYSAITASIQGHYAEIDDFAPPKVSRGLERSLVELGKDAEFFVYPNTEHAFFNDARPEVYDAAASNQAWDRLIPFLEESLR
ncbi:unnamed protein product, partial [Acidithrix sp. C25]